MHMRAKTNRCKTPGCFMPMGLLNEEVKLIPFVSFYDTDFVKETAQHLDMHGRSERNEGAPPGGIGDGSGGGGGHGQTPKRKRSIVRDTYGVSTPSDEGTSEQKKVVVKWQGMVPRPVLMKVGGTIGANIMDLVCDPSSLSLCV